MHCLADLFAYMYDMDISTLRLSIGEARRILAERERNAALANASISRSSSPSLANYSGMRLLHEQANK